MTSNMTFLTDRDNFFEAAASRMRYYRIKEALIHELMKYNHLSIYKFHHRLQNNSLANFWCWLSTINPGCIEKSK